MQINEYIRSRNNNLNPIEQLIISRCRESSPENCGSLSFTKKELKDIESAQYFGVEKPISTSDSKRIISTICDHFNVPLESANDILRKFYGVEFFGKLTTYHAKKILLRLGIHTNSKKDKSKKTKTISTKITKNVIKSDNFDPTSDAFLKSFAWRRLRYQVLLKYESRCMCCGATPATGAMVNVDHIKPRKTHPHLALDFNNLQVLCSDCNHGKGNWNSTDFRKSSSNCG